MVCEQLFSEAGTVKTVEAEEMLLIVRGNVPQLVMVTCWSDVLPTLTS
jgi:hypothetical protein